MSTEPARTVAEALEAVQKWRSSEEERQAAELVEVDQEIKSLQDAISNLQQQLEALSKFRVEVAEKGASLDDTHRERTNEALFVTLKAQAAMLLEREAVVSGAEKVRRDTLPTALRGSEVGHLVPEYEQFKNTVEPSLMNMPESYRTALMKVNEEIKERLQSQVRALLADPIQVQDAEVITNVLFAIDAPEGAPELLIVVVPVSDQVHSNWLEREEGLQTWVAARTVQALYQAGASSGLPGAQVLCGGYMDLLAIEMEIVGASADFKDKLLENLAQTVAGAEELHAAKIKIVPTEVNIDLLLPPEGEEVEDDG